MARAQYKKWLEEDGLTALKTWARLGLTDQDIADNMEINVSTLYTWKKKYNEIAKALTYAKQAADAIVENALYKRATGFRYDEVTQERKYNELTKKYEVVITKIVTKLAIPDVTAQIYWLKNRNQKRWRDKIESNDISNVELLEQLKNKSNDYR